ncbi:MAG: UDP-N-acetylglucosamine--LPS N-acetylglucosamine transferase [Paenibacillus sp.]|nr:UDP-N-acetylglucosamine--LPS N-acetylglucosamine transferase [Paenibacillus sp.]
MELGAFLHPTLAPWIFSAYRKTLISQPKLYGMVYRSQYKKSLNRITQLALHRIFYSQTSELIQQLKPDTIVCTHPFPNIVVSRLKRAGLNVPLCTVITDYDAHGTWINPEVDKYLVSTAEVKDKLMQKGVPDHSIEVTGIPVHPNFREQHNREELRQQFGLKQMPTVLVMGGGWGMVDKENLMSYLTCWRDRIQFIYCMGNNEKLRQELAEQAEFQHPNIHLLAFTREIDKLMDVSDLLITKPGGMTCSEGLAKGIPMLFYSPLPGQEEENCQYFTEQGLGEQIKSLETIDSCFENLVRHYPLIQERRAALMQDWPISNPNPCTLAIMQMLS